MHVTDKVASFFADYPDKTFEAGEHIALSHDTNPPVSFIVDGRVSQYDISENGNQITLTLYKQGAFFPLLPVLSGHPNKYFFEAFGTVCVRQAPAEDVLEFLRGEPEVMLDLLCRLYSGMDGLLGRMSLLMDGSAKSRILLELSFMAERFGSKQADNSYLVAITQTQLASQTGLARETVSRELKKLSESGKVTLGKGAICVWF
ncbi:MAG: Crp/Fnr family transcriptional regulator [Candidatus Saccharimonadales bacterium]